MFCLMPKPKELGVLGLEEALGESGGLPVYFKISVEPPAGLR